MRFEFSAGGIVFKRKAKSEKLKDDLLILVAQHSQHHGWVFPKGLIDPSAGSGQVSETKEEAALREVEEETGIKAKILKPLSSTEFWYILKGEKIKKTVYYFLMEATGGNIENHDMEMEKVEWLPQEEVEERLTYKSEKEVWEQARKMIK